MVWTALLFLVVTLPGFVVGFAILRDRETGGLAALRASPITGAD